MKFRHRPVEVEAMQIETGRGWYQAWDWLESFRNVRARMMISVDAPEIDVIEIETPIGIVQARTDDWLIHQRTTDGRDVFMVMGDLEFAENYEAVLDDDTTA